nr:MAG: MuF-C-terminal domain [Bacteriophage sp.]
MARIIGKEYLARQKRAEEAKKKGEKRQADIIVERADQQIDNIINKANQTIGQYVPGAALRRLENGTQGGYPQREETRRVIGKEYLARVRAETVEKAKAKAGQINSTAVKSAYKQVRKDARGKAERHVAVNTTAPLDFAEAGRYRAKFLSGRSVDKVQREYDTTRERAEEYRQKALHLRETGDAQREASSTTATGKDREDETRFGSYLTRSADQWDKLAQEESSKALELARELGYAKVYQVQKTEADIVKKPDFAQKSEADPKVLELGNEENRPQMSRATAIYGGINHSPYFETRGSETFMTDEEVKIFTYLYNTQGENAAEQYYDMLSDMLELRRGTEKAAGLDNTFERTMFSLSQGVRRFGRGIEQLFTDEQLPLYGEDYAENIINANASHGERILYSAANSIGNMLPMVAISAATQGIGGAVGLSAEAAQAAGKAAGVASMFAGAKGNAYTEAMQQGMTKAQASTYSTLVGASEAGLEYLIGGISRFSMGSGIGDFVQEAISGLGRGYARVAFRFAGSLIGGSIDEIIEENTQNYLEPLFINYVTGKEAEMPGWDEFIETTLSTLITTGVMESRGSFAEAKRNIAFTPFEAQLEWVSAAKNVFAEGTDVAEFADVLESRLQAGDPMSYKEFREGIRALGVDEKTMDRIAKGKLTVDEVLTSTENGDKIRLKEWQAGQNSTAQQVQSQTQRAETVQAENNNVEDAMTAAEQEADRLIAEWNRGENSTYELGQQAQLVMQQLEEEVREGTATDPGSYMNRQIQLQEIVRSAPEASTAQQAAQNTTEGIDNNGRTEIFDDGAQRDAGLGTGEQAGAVAEGAGGPVAGGAGTQTQNGRADISGGREAVSAREIGVKGGTAEKNIHVVIPSEIDTARAEDAALVEKMNRIVVEAAAKGQDVTFVSGAITVESGDRTVRVEGVRQTGDNGRTQIYLQVDGRRDMERIYRHEDFHDAVEAQPGLLQRLADRLMQEYGREEMLRMAIDYAEAYDGIYGEFTEDMTEEQENELAVRYMEEAFADAYAGIRRGQRRIRSAQKTLENSGEIETLRTRGQTAQNVQEEQNGKLSIADGLLDKLRRVAENRYRGADEIYIGETSDFLTREIGVDAAKVTMPASKAYAAMVTEERAKMDDRYNKNTNYHGLGADGLLEILEKSENPVAAFVSKPGEKGSRRNRLVLVTDKEINGGTAVVVEEIETRGKYKNKLLDVNKVITAYERDKVANDIETAAATGKLLFLDKKRSQSLNAGNQGSNSQGTMQSSDFQTNIQNFLADVKWESGEYDKKVSGSGPVESDIAAAFRKALEKKTSFSVSDDLNELNQQVQGAEAATRSDALKAQAEAELQEYLKKGKGELAQSISKMSDAALKKQTERVKQGMTAESEGLRVNEAAEAVTEGVQKYAESRNQRLGDMLQMIKSEQNKRAAAKREAEKQRRAEARKTPEAKLQRKVDKLQKQIDIERAALRQAKQGGTLTSEMAEQSEERITGLRQELLDYKNELQEKKTAAREEKKRQQDQAAKEAILKEKPRQATRDLTNALIESFNVPEANRTQATIQIRELAEQAYQEGQKGPITNELRNKMLDTLIELGTEREMLDNRESEISQRLREKWIQVPDEVRTAFGEEWADIKESAYDSGIYFTYKDGYRSIQSWTAELQKEFGQMFDTTRSLQQQLRDIVNLASEGYGKQMTIGDMIRQNADDYSWSMREKVEELGKVLDDQLQRFGEKANIEVKLAARSAKSLQAQQQYFENRLRSRTEQQMESLAREKLLKSAKQLSRMANKSSAEQRTAIQKVIGNIDLVARSITPDGIENLQELALSYRQAMEAMGENFIRDKDVEDRLARLDKKRIDNMDDMDEVRQLAQDITAVATQIRNRNQMLATVRRETVSEMAENVRKEVKAAKGSNAGKARDFVLMQTDAKRFFLELGGWKEDGATAELLHGLERGEEKRRLYEMRAQGLFNGFLADKANKKWVESATGKDAQWITVDTPRGAAVIKDGTASAINELTMTPMMRVSLIMHSKNEDNLRHIAEGGMRVPNRALYKKGNISEAYARGDVVTLTPQAVRDIVRGATAQEIQFAAILSKYFDGQAKNAINEVSMIMDGYERAMVKNYFPIESDRAFTVQDNDQVRNDISLTGLGFLKQRTGKGANPVLLQDASQTFQRSVESVSKYYGLALPIRDLNAVMNSTYYENAGKVRLSQTDRLLGRDRSKEGGGAIRTQSAESVRNVIAGKWGKSSINYIEKLVGDLQRSGKDMDAFSGFFGWLRGQYASAVISFNPSSMLKQWGSYATAMAYLSPGDLAAGLLRGMKGKVSTDTLGQYSSVYWYRNQGNATQELHDLTTNEALVTKLPLGYNWAQAMDSFITRRLMLACERNVSRTTGLTPGTSEEINSGTDAYWTKVATLFNKVVLDTQSNSSILERAAVARANPNNISRFMTMFRADAFQSFNLLREGQGKYQAARAAYLQNKTAENRRAMIAARKQLARSGAAVIASQFVSASISVMINALRRRDELWDEDGPNWGEVMKQLGLGMVEGLAGISIAGEELVGLVESIAFDETWYGPDVNALQLLTDTAESAISTAKILKNGKWELAPGALKDLALEASTAMGLPLKNVEKYVQVLPRWVAPELMAEYDNIWDEVDRNALSKSSVLDIKADIGVLLDNRTEDMSDEDKEELTRLYLAGGTGALPAAVPNAIKYTDDNGEEVTEQLDYSQKQTYKKEWSKIVSGAIGALLKSDLYNEADDKTKTKMLNNLYTYANGLSAEKVVPEKTADGWIDDARTLSGEGVKIADYIQWHTMLSEMDSDDASGTSRTGLKNARALELANEKGWTWAVPSDAPDELKWMEDDTEQTLQLTDAQKKQYRKTWTGIVYGSVGDLMQSDEYQSGTEKERGALIQKLTSYASALAAYEIEPKKVPDTWILGGQQAVKDGVPLDEYIVFRALYSELDSINEDGDEESGLKNKRTLDLIESMGWSDQAEQSAYINTVASESKEAEAEALQKAGMTWEQANDVLAVPGTGVVKKAAVTATNASEATKAKVLASYDKSEKQKTAKLVMTGLKYGIPMRRYTDVLQNADADGSGGVSQEEAGKYIATLGLSVQEAAYLWQMVTNGKEGKKNPFSSYFGAEFYSAAGAFD